MNEINKTNLKEIRKLVFSNIDLEKIEGISDNRQALIIEIKELIKKQILLNKRYLSSYELQLITTLLVDEIMGLGPLRELVDDSSISDILVNGPNDIYVERYGKLEKTNISFLDNEQLTDIAKRMVAKVGRRIDESQPLVDARLADGSRLNVVIAPIALDGTSISIRKFSNKKLSLEELINYNAINQQVANLLVIAAISRCNILISGGTGSGKTTMLNALSAHISSDERIITLEDAAELKLNQPHLVRLETRMAGVEDSGLVNMRDLVINALRMRPDRIIIGECRGAEAFEMLQAMNTGHDGSMSTIHANTPKDALSRLENLVMMAGFNLPIDAIRTNIASAIDLIIQIARLNDGSRKLISIMELCGIDENDKYIYNKLVEFIPSNERKDGKIVGSYKISPLASNSRLAKKALMFNISKYLEEFYKSV